MQAEIRLVIEVDSAMDAQSVRDWIHAQIEMVNHEVVSATVQMIEEHGED